jgi:hypothetical protein
MMIKQLDLFETSFKVKTHKILIVNAWGFLYTPFVRERATGNTNSITFLMMAGLRG